MFLFFSILQYKQVTRVRTIAPIYAVGDFGFEEKANYSITINIKDIDKMANHTRYIILNKEQNTQYVSKHFNASMFCKNDSLSFLHKDINQQIISISDVIEKKGVYYQKLVNCESEGYISLTVKQVFHNPSTHLDYRWIGIIKAKFYVVVAFIVLIAFWIANWVFHFRVQIWIHYCFTAVFIFAALYNGIRFMELKKLDVQDETVFLTTLRITAEVFGIVAFMTTLLFAAKGWCIVRDELSLFEVVSTLLYSVLIITLMTISVYVYLGSFEIVVLIAGIVVSILFIRELIVSINDASLHIMAHLLAISNAGIDPETTPIYRKHTMYTYFNWTIIGACTMLLILLCSSVFFEIPLWANETSTDVTLLVFLTALALIFRLRGTDTAGYSSITGGDFSDVNEIALTDIENARHTPLSKGGVKWEEGMPLPAQPNLVSKNSEQPEEQSILVLSTPDGTDTINAQLSPSEENDIE